MTGPQKETSHFNLERLTKKVLVFVVDVDVFVVDVIVVDVFCCCCVSCCGFRLLLRSSSVGLCLIRWFASIDGQLCLRRFDHNNKLYEKGSDFRGCLSWLKEGGMVHLVHSWPGGGGG